MISLRWWFVSEEKVKKVWSGYKLYAQTAFVPRSGYELTGMTAEQDRASVAKMFANRGESVLEHQAKTTWLVIAFRENFGGYFFDRWCGESSAFYSMSCMLMHDVGEVVVGDIADDGNPEHENKEAAELEVYWRLAETCSFYDASAVYWPALVGPFKEFQKKQSQDGRALYALDKLEAVLMQIFLEGYGVTGHISEKPYETDLDNYFVQVTGSDKTADTWAAHLKWLLRDFEDKITEPVFSVMRFAIKDVRGKDYEWWDSYIPTDDISLESLEK